jgi:hypothetical protein
LFLVNELPSDEEIRVSVEDDNQPFDKFELMTALLLGLAGIGAALAGLQGGQWGGKQLEAFAAANSLTTKAATQYTEDTVAINADYAAVASAKAYILMARDANDAKAKERNLDLASYYYSYQMSERGYKAMGLPLEFFVEDEEEAAAGGAPAAPAGDPAAPAADPAGPAAADDEEEEVAAPAEALMRDIPDDQLFETLHLELDEDYIDQSLAQGTQMFADADKKFEEGRVANENGDKFDLAVVFYTVALFFAGLGLVFKTKVRWGFFLAGVVIFLGSSLFIVSLPWAG